MLARGIDSLRTSAYNEVEIILAVDGDDLETIEQAKRLDCIYKIFPERLGYGRLHEYFNDIAHMSTGDWLMLWDDSATITTPGWDQKLYELPSNIMVASPNNHFGGMCCFPAVRRIAYEAVGSFSIGTPHVDSFWQCVGSEINRICAVDFYIHHDRPDITGVPWDQTFVESRQAIQTSSPQFYTEPNITNMRLAGERIMDALRARNWQ